MLRSLAIIFLCAMLGIVYWLGAAVYSENIESDISARTQTELDDHQPGIADATRVVDGRDVTVSGEATTVLARASAGKEVGEVWGVRVLQNDIGVADPVAAPVAAPPEYNLHAEHMFPDLRVHGLVDTPSFETVENIHRALPPESMVDYSGLTTEAPGLLRGPRIVETGIAAVTQLDPGTLTITDDQFILEGTVYSDDRKKTVEQLIDVRRSELEPLEVIVNIQVEERGITQACQDGMDQVLANNVLNYAVNHYKILDEHLSVLGPMADVIQGVCQGQIGTVLVEGHADYTGGAGYNQGLSERRSGTVGDHLIEQGVSPDLISAFGYGEFRPIASNETTAGRAANRRTEIYLLIDNQMPGNSVPEISLIEQ